MMTYEGNDTKEPVDECDPRSPQGGSRRHRSLYRSGGGENGGERDDGATNVAGGVPERPPVARRMEIGELCAEPRRQAQRHRRGLECSECIRALRAPELLSRRSGGAEQGRDQRSRVVQKR